MKLSHIRGIDTLRAIGIILVVVYHLYPEFLPGGFFGVDMFFVISGFLVTSLFIREKREKGNVDIIKFYVRRIQRLLPPLALMVVITLSLALLISPDLRVGIREQTAAVFGWVTNYYEIMLGGSYEDQFIPRLFVHTWALGLEMQFYLMWGLIIGVVSFLCARAAKRIESMNTFMYGGGQAMPPERQIIFFISVVIGVLSYILMQFGYIGLEDPSPVYYAATTRMYPLMIGSALGAVFGMKVPKVRLPVIISLPGFVLSILAILWMSRTFSFSDPRTYSYGILLASLLTVAAISCLMSLQLKKFFGDPKFLDAIGKRSYSIYLFHWPLYHIFKEFGINGMGPFPYNTPQPVYAILSLAVTALLAELSYQVFEVRRPIAAIKKEQAVTSSEPTAAEIYAAVGRSESAKENVIQMPQKSPRRWSSLLIPTIVIMTLCAQFSIYALINEPQKTGVEEDYLHQQVLINIGKMDQYNDYLAWLAMDPVAMHGRADLLPPTPSQIEAGISLDDDADETQQNAANASNRDDPAGPVTPIAPPGGAEVTIFGDSVALGAAETLQRTLGSVIVDAEVSRNMWAGAGLVREYVERGELGEYVVIALFTNPINSMDTATNEMIAEIPAGHRVIAVTPFGKPYMEEAAEMVRRLPQWYDFITVADWNAAIRDNRELLAADGLHMRGEDSRQIYANLIAKAIDQASRKPAKR